MWSAELLMMLGMLLRRVKCSSDDASRMPNAIGIVAKAAMVEIVHCVIVHRIKLLGGRRLGLPWMLELTQQLTARVAFLVFLTPEPGSL